MLPLCVSRETCVALAPKPRPHALRTLSAVRGCTCAATGALKCGGTVQKLVWLERYVWLERKGTDRSDCCGTTPVTVQTTLRIWQREASSIIHESNPVMPGIMLIGSDVVGSGHELAPAPDRRRLSFKMVLLLGGVALAAVAVATTVTWLSVTGTCKSPRESQHFIGEVNASI